MSHKGRKFTRRAGEWVETTAEKPLVYDLDSEQLPFRIESDHNAELLYYMWLLAVNFTVQSNRYAFFGVQLGKLITEYLGKEKLNAMVARSTRKR